MLSLPENDCRLVLFEVFFSLARHLNLDLDQAKKLRAGIFLNDRIADKFAHRAAQAAHENLCVPQRDRAVLMPAFAVATVGPWG